MAIDSANQSTKNKPVNHNGVEMKIPVRVERCSTVKK